MSQLQFDFDPGDSSAPTKRCARCRETKPLSCFVFQRNGKPISYCKPCHSTITAEWFRRKTERRHRQAREEGLLCQVCERRLPPEAFANVFQIDNRRRTCKECRRAYQREYQKSWAPKHKKPPTEAQRERDRERRKQLYQAHWAADPERMRERRRQANEARRTLMRESGSAGAVPRALCYQVIAKYGYRCLACGATENITIDHVVPVSVGGMTVLENLQVLCLRCNSAKNARTIDYRKD